MRLCLKTTPNSIVVPFDYQKNLAGVLHKWLGQNDMHDAISLYSFSWLHGGTATSEGVNFKNGASWFLSFFDDSKLKTIMSAILKDPKMFCGMRVIDIVIKETPDLSDVELFYLASPVLIKFRNMETGKTTHYTYDDSQSSDLLKETVLHKMKDAGLPLDDTLEIFFNKEYIGKKIKYVNYKNVRNKSCLCPVFIKAKNETKQFIWNVGIGNSTGIGFGAIF